MVGHDRTPAHNLGMHPVRAAALAVVLALFAGVPPVQAAEGPAPGSTAVIGDFGTADEAARRVADLVAREQPSWVISVGDNVYDDADYPRRVGDYYGAWVRGGTLLPVAGNHDYAEGIEAFDSYFSYLEGRRTYTRIVGRVQYYFLDSEAAVTSTADRSAQRAWLAYWMPRSKAEWQVVVLHHPPYSSGDRHGSTWKMRWPFREWGADLVLAGHEHNYERVVRDGLTYVVNGSGGRDLYPFGTTVPGSRVRFDADHGAVFLTATRATLTGEFWSVQGTRVDRFVLRRAGNPLPAAGVSRP
jgi:predicted phosphodiesterase